MSSLPGIPGIRAIARALMPEFVRLGYSRRAVQRALQEVYGQAYRWDTLRKDYNEYLGLMYYRDYWDKLKPQDVPKRFMFIEKDMPVTEKYYTRMRATFEDINTGEEITRHVSFYTNEVNTLEEWEAILDDLYGTTECGIDKRFLYLERPEYFHNQLQPY